MTRKRSKTYDVRHTPKGVEASKSSTHDQKPQHEGEKSQVFNLKKCVLLIFFFISLITAFVITIYPNVLPSLFHDDENASSSESRTSNGNGQPLSPLGDTHADGDEDTPGEMNNFKPHWQKSFSVKRIFADGRRIPPIQLQPQKETNSSVRLFVFDDFLSERECEGLIRAHTRHVQEMDESPLLCFDSRSTLKRHLSGVGIEMAVTPDVFSPGTTCLNASLSSQIQTVLNSNWSYSTAFYPEESIFSTIVSNRIQEAMGLDPDTGGKFQITSYPVGKAYKIHTDCVLGSQDLRDRSVSVIMYLNDVRDGGQTQFPELGISVQPKKGRALVWNNMSPDGRCEPDSRHMASVVKSGSKHILMRWYYYKTFYSIGKRMAGPSLPARGVDVPMVMCDAYTHGSCRWYDEWTPQVLTRYMQNQHSYT